MSFRVVTISDTHGKHAAIPPLPAGDVLIHAGDFTNTGEMGQIADFMNWFSAQPHRYKIFIAGNHDTTIHTEYYRTVGSSRFHRRKAYDPETCRSLLVSKPNVIYLEDSGTELEFSGEDGVEHKIKVWGSPWQPEFCDWAFNLNRGEEIAAKWRLIPTDTDILITHGPPKGHGDKCQDGFEAGCEDLLREMAERIHPRVHIFGHIHEGYGADTNGETLFVNSSTCTFSYRPTNPPIVIDIPFNALEVAAAVVSDT